MNDIDGDRSGDPLDQISDPILRALVGLEELVRAEIERERQRAEAAESSLDEARRELAAANAELALAVSRSKSREERTYKALGEYLEDNVRAQLGLIAVARKLLQTLGAPEPARGLPVEKEPKPGSGVRAAAPNPLSPERHVGPRLDSPRNTTPGSSVPLLYGHTDSDPITDEHRIIDQSNQADMERLDCASRRFAGAQAFRRRNLLTGS